MVLFVRALDAIFGVAIARKSFNHFVDTPGRISTDSRIEKHCIPNIEFVRWHRFPFSGGRLLGEGQRITQAKPFSRAKTSLGIRSIRDGFGLLQQIIVHYHFSHAPVRQTSDETGTSHIDLIDLQPES
jgi:hypothetical protein